MSPRYREVNSNEIPEISPGNGITIRIICGKVDREQGTVRDIVTDPEYLDITIPANTDFIHPTKSGHTVFAYIIEGKARFCREKNPYAYEVESINYFDFERNPFTANETLILFEGGE